MARTGTRVVLVCGSRSWTDQDSVMRWLERLQDDANAEDKDLVVIHGGARGPDTMAGRVAMGLGIAHREYPADWMAHGKKAGHIRNQQMLDEGKPDLVLAFWDGESRGTADMIRRATKAGVETLVIRHQYVDMCTTTPIQQFKLKL